MDAHDPDLSAEAVERLARPIPVSNNLQVTPAITHGYSLELRPVRWLPYKPDGRRQMKQRGRWQEMNEYGGWGNCKTPNEIWPGLTAPDLISGYQAALAENARLRAVLSPLVNHPLFHDREYLSQELNEKLDAARAALPEGDEP